MIETAQDCDPQPTAVGKVTELATARRIRQTGAVLDVHREPNEWVVVFGPFQLVSSRRLLLRDGKPVRIGSRALDLLVALVERPGEVISKHELIARVWSQTFVEEGNLKVLMLSLRRLLADGENGNRYIWTAVGRGYCFVAPVTLGTAAVAPEQQPPAARRMTNLAAPFARLIGVDGAVDAVSSHFDHHRIVTLTGPGGVGKTCIAAASAARLIKRYPDGAWFVDLTATVHPQLLPIAVGSATHTDISSFLSFLSDKHMLIVFDGCEHVIEAMAALALDILRSASRVSILATSREPLSVEGERVHHVAPLAFPTAAAAIASSTLIEYPAVQYFVECAANGAGDFALREDEAPLVVEICRRLDGMPLAIEMAASSIDVLGLRGVVSLLDYPLQLPRIRRRTAPARHQTLRAALDWSYELLSAPEQRMLRRLSVFNGAFTTEAAVSVAQGPPYTESDLVDQVLALTAKSLITADGGRSGASLRLLETTRSYAFEKLERSDELDATLSKYHNSQRARDGVQLTA